MWEWDHKEGWASKNWSFQNMVLEKTLESPMNSMEIKSVHPKGNQPWIFIERTDAEALIFWTPNIKSWLIGKDLDAGKDWRQEEKEAIEDEMVGWHHQLNGHEFEQALGDSEGQGSLACCSPWGRNMGFPGGASGKEFACQCKRCKRCSFDPWVRKMTSSKKW